MDQITVRHLLTIEMVCWVVMTVIAAFAIPSAYTAIRAGEVEEVPVQVSTFEAVSR